MELKEAITRDFHPIIRRCQTLNALVKRIGKLAESLPTAETNDIRRRRYISIQVGLEKLALQEHELHCEMVNLGIADYSADRYGKITLKLQFGESVLYFREPEEESQVHVEKEKDMVQTPLELAVEEAHRPEITSEEIIRPVLTDPTGSLTTYKDEPGDDTEEELDQEGDDGEWYGGDDLATLESFVKMHQAKMDRGEPNHLANFEQRLKVAKAKAGIQEPKPEKVKAAGKAKKTAEPEPTPPPPAVTMKLSEATKVWKKTGEVPEGFQVVGDNLYKKAIPKDPDRHFKAAEPKSPAEPVKDESPTYTSPEGNPTKIKPEPVPPVKPAVDGPFGADAKPTGKDLIW